MAEEQEQEEDEIKRIRLRECFFFCWLRRLMNDFFYKKMEILNRNKYLFLYFQVEHDPKGANGDGMAVVSSLRSFDREQQKEYEVPIVIKDSGNPSMSGNILLKR